MRLSNRFPSPMPDYSFLSVLGLGFLLGLRHAGDADHLVAVTTLTSNENRLRRSLAIGALWGMGHTFSLVIAGVVVVLLRIPITERTAATLELGVALMLVVLGLRHLRPRHSHWHSQDGWIRSGFPPFAVGLVHGAAGSAALMLLVLATISSSAGALLYVVIFGIGSIMGMAALTLLLSLPLFFAQDRLPAGFNYLPPAAGLSSCLFGLYLLIQAL